MWLEAFSILSGLASVIGLLFSYLAWRRAQGAEKAAKQAREAVRHGNAASDLRTMANTAKELLQYLQNSQFSAARIRGSDLTLEIIHANHRWQGFLSPESREQLQEASQKIGLVTRALATIGEAAEAEIRVKMVKACREAVSCLAAEAGNLQYAIENNGGQDGETN